MDSIATERLEDALQTYEDFGRFNEPFALDPPKSMVEKLPKYEGALKNWRGIRKALLDSSKCVFNSADWKIPVYPDPGMPSFTLWRMMGTFPIELWCWMHYARRIYAPDAQLQDFLLRGDYSALRWADLLFPFDVFVMELSKPLVQLSKDSPGEDEFFDAFLVLIAMPTGEVPGSIQLRLFNQKQNGQKGFLRQSDRRDHDADFARGKFNRLLLRRSKISKRNARREGEGFDNATVQGTCMFNVEIPAGEDVRVAIEPADLRRCYTGLDSEDSTEGDFAVFSQVLKLSVGLAVYMTHMSGDSEPGEWVQARPGRPGALNAITDGAQICKVVGKSTFDPSIFRPLEGGKRRRSGYEMPPHHREAHWRRPRGSAPDAPKTVKVNATFIHRNRMPPDAVAGGTRKVVRAFD